jgi:hypothetical protein
MNKVKVTFTYDETTRKWIPTVSGVMDETDARHAFNAVVFSCTDLKEELFDHHKVVPLLETGDYEIHPAV